MTEAVWKKYYKKKLQKYVGCRQKKIFSEFEESECNIGIPHFNDADTIENSIYVNVLGFFHLVYYSPKAEEYQDAVFEDIFPAIRRREKEGMIEKILYIGNKMNDLIKQIYF